MWKWFFCWHFVVGSKGRGWRVNNCGFDVCALFVAGNGREFVHCNTAQHGRVWYCFLWLSAGYWTSSGSGLPSWSHCNSHHVCGPLP
jgi:hypothetical protein